MTSPAALGFALLAAYGVLLVYTAVAFGWHGVTPGPRADNGVRRRDRVGQWLAQAGLGDVRLTDFAAVTGVLFVVGAGLAFTVFGGVVAPAVAGAATAGIPAVAAKRRRAERRDAARDAWPRMIEELRLLATAAGRSVPQALFDVGRRGPGELRAAFDAAHREWLITTDFERSVRVLKSQLADATADAVCETLLIAHEMGGSDIDRRLQSLVEDRVQDLQGRKDAAAKQAGARFARAFVLVVPAGMALVGLSVGDGRAAYASDAGQTAVVAAMMMVTGCWWWAGRLMRLPDEERVFHDGPQPSARRTGGERVR